MKVGIAGIGKMGAAIAARLIEVGHEVTVWNRTPDKARSIAGASVAATPAALAQNVETSGRAPHAHRCRRYRENGRSHRRPAD